MDVIQFHIIFVFVDLERFHTRLTNFLISLLLNNRDALKKAQDELDIHVGAKRQVNESDIKNLVYLRAILMETMHLYPVAPLQLPHQSMEDCTVSGYHVCAGTQHFVNALKVHHDPKVWQEP
ncbi:hypothetical protein CISIN_1g048154mg [Citrus sinensis]|uniref:Cytochrome P450 n=1 Tax=Citrus sinensis TaxID=2711 RepID=A0A067DF15_CITSI|nr:hypothetical protein CISIN_1g048154mg [Citrus sinensis]